MANARQKDELKSVLKRLNSCTALESATLLQNYD